MKKIFLAALITSSSLVAKADIIKCGFTEPFVTSVYSTSRSTLTYKNDIEGTTEVIKNVSFQIKSPAVFDLVAKDGTVLQTLTANNQGSDGMSNLVYPYDVKDTGLTTTSNLGRGGCSSNYLHAPTEH